MVAGREQVSPQRLEDMSRSFTATDAEPFQVFGGYVKQSRARRMRSGEIQPVEVEVHPDPRCQELLEQIREAEIEAAYKIAKQRCDAYGGDEKKACLDRADNEREAALNVAKGQRDQIQMDAGSVNGSTP